MIGIVWYAIPINTSLEAIAMKVPRLISFISKRKGHGRSCNYYPVRKGVGVKLYDNSRERDIAYNQQKAFAKIGLAPKVSRKFEVPYGFNPKGYNPEGYRFGYVTQSAPTNNLKYKEAGGDEHFNKLACSYDGYSINDVFYGNVGWLRGKPVFIDFGEGSDASSPEVLTEQDINLLEELMKP